MLAEFEASGVETKKGSEAVIENSLLERVTAAAEERHLSKNTLTAYRRTWLKAIGWAVADYSIQREIALPGRM